MVQNRHSYRRNFKIVGIMDFSNIDEGHIDGEPELHYFYNREERIKNAPPIVQEYYNGGLRPVRGFKILFVNKTNRLMFFMILFFVGFIFCNSSSFSLTTDVANYPKSENLPKTSDSWFSPSKRTQYPYCS